MRDRDSEGGRVSSHDVAVTYTVRAIPKPSLSDLFDAIARIPPYELMLEQTLDGKPLRLLAVAKKRVP